jgi:hypothetical protein
MTSSTIDAGKPQSGDQHSPPHIHLRVQTPRGLWSMTEPVDADRRPDYPLSTKIQVVIDDAREVFKFVEPDSKYTLFQGQTQLDPTRTLASYHLQDDVLLVVSVQGGNASELA